MLSDFKLILFCNIFSENLQGFVAGIEVKDAFVLNPSIC